jgi:hypothetical protein
MVENSFAQQQHLGNSHFIFLVESRREEHGRAEADLETLPSNDTLKGEVVTEIIDQAARRAPIASPWAHKRFELK